MTHAELLRKHAVDAANEGGIWFSGEYMGMLASMAESIEAENAELRELVRISIEFCNSGSCDGCPIQRNDGSCPFVERARELGIEVDE